MTTGDVPAAAAAHRLGVAYRSSPAQRAAIIISVLGKEVARPIVERLDDQALARVVAELETISVIPHDHLVEVVIDFLRQLDKSAGSLRGGRDRARELLADLIEPARMQVVLGQTAGADDTPDTPALSPWQRLEDRPADEVAAYLNGLSANICAIILGKLSAAKSSDVLVGLDDVKARKVVGHMVNAKAVDDGLDVIVGRTVELEFLNRPVSAALSTAHLGQVADVLSLVQNERRTAIMDFLKLEHPPEFRQIERSFLSLERLPEILERNAVSQILREFTPAQTADLIACLNARYPATASFLLASISSRMADQIRSEVARITAPGAERMDEIERSFLTVLMAMKRKGQIELIEPATE